MLFALSAAGLAAHGFGAVARELDTPRSLRATEYAGSNACRSCHPDHSASFHRTFHRTMTQEAGPQSVLGDFDSGQSLDYFGVRARMSRGPAGEFLMSFSAASGTQRWQARVERSVGSRRYQQYLAREGDVYFRLPIAWDIAEARFIHMNGAFLTPDPEPTSPGAPIARADYDRHVTRWNDNCVFCHNVHPNPGLDVASGRFRTQVAELGIACEACHGPAGEHVARNTNPLRRYALSLAARPDPSIRNPARMSGARSAEVCGRCHGQRLTSDIGKFLREGDPFVPGEPLAQWSKPLWRDTTQNGESGLFAPRFWPDGTARLTAYEFQGYLQSPCARSPEFSCESCHAMHQGDPRGQIRPERSGDRACTQCHTQLREPAALRAHSHHDPGGAGARCQSCHMPELVYGLLGVHVSHRIESPDPTRAARDHRPDACTLCHIDRSRSWAAQASARWQGAAQLTAADPELSEVARMLFGGDPIERAIAASALGKSSAQLSAAMQPRVLGMLLDVLDVDAYPAVRRIAERSLRARLGAELSPLLAAYSATLEPARRSEVLGPLRAALRTTALDYPDAQTRAYLRDQAAEVAIEIGE
jgi:predicted CXXCH cytochrome family protein